MVQVDLTCQIINMTISVLSGRDYLFALSFLLLSNFASAHNKVVVIPLSGEDARPLQNVISVAKSNGDFDNPIDAIASITDNSDDNPYLIVIAPGVYELAEQLVMREFIDISGSGPKLTRLVGSISDASITNSSALVVGANNTSLRSLTVENADGENGTSVGISCSSGIDPVSPKLVDINVVVSGGRNNVGLNIGNSSSPALEDVDIHVHGGSSEQIGIFNGFFAGLSATRLSIVVEDGIGDQYGVRSVGLGRTRLSGSTISVRDGGDAQFGVFLGDNSRLELRDSRLSVRLSGDTQFGIRVVQGALATVTDSDVRVFSSTQSSFGVRIDGGSSTVVRGSSISGSSRSISVSFSATPRTSYISDSFLSAEPFTTNAVCSFVFLEDGTPLDANCND